MSEERTYEFIHPSMPQQEKSKEFKIERCRNCGRYPTVVKHSEIDGKGRYEIKCCSKRILSKTETQCIYDWNAEQNTEDDLK